ncbi:unnamed protein product [Brassicogethes aeneus]|uniref:Thyroglobulin type-1 domain-containing protein n=1 Tax=Brassicogethes aeneus TaxID=1431903 RepID=A0A9P0AZW1_BRAAE|nr:unnamed protein product [Brassicogethes aeneus]
MNKMILKVILLINLCYALAQNENILCSSYCRNVVCDDKPTDCDIQNSTNYGIYLPSADTCNCCKQCFTYLKINARCSSGSLDGSLISNICGPGLSCIDGKCQTMKTSCYEKQANFDARKKEGTIGTLEVRPNCDGQGFYETYQCIPGQACYCVNKNGERIFGLSEFTDIPLLKLKCQCSRNYHEALEIFDKIAPHEHFRCAANGNFDRLQCIGNKCLCVDIFDGTPDFDAEIRSVDEISKLDCFNKTIHPNGFYKECERRYLDALNQTLEYKKAGYSNILSVDFPKCDLDGTYASLQENKTHKTCVDIEGNILNSIEKIDPLSDKMNCKCARAASLARKSEVPKCLENGNYDPKQCRKGYCRCVDENGNQTCENAESCPDVPEEKSLICS